MDPFAEISPTDQKFKDLDFHGDTFEDLEFTGCSFHNCKFIECTFQNLSFVDCTFQNCDLSLLKCPQTSFKRVEFKSCRLIGINWSAANWEQKSLLEHQTVSFQDCLLDHSIFIGLNLKSTSFEGCKARSLDFEGTNLSQANFRNADLEGTRFAQCNLTKANFTGASNYLIRASENTLHQTRFSLPEAISLLHGLDIILED